MPGDTDFRRGVASRRSGVIASTELVYFVEARVSSLDTEYYRQRASAERELAKHAERANVAAIHAELARQYDALMNRAELRPTLRLAFPPTAMPDAGDDAHSDSSSSADEMR